MQGKNKKSQNNSLRIIGGQWRGRKLAIAEADGLRPTGDRIRETLFNWLAPYVHGSRCLDLFAGTGALGLEALSRGAAQVNFVELNRRVSQQLKDHLATLHCNCARVDTADSLLWLQNPPAEQFDLVFIDPPFSQNLWQQALTYLTSANCLAAGAMVYLEMPKTQTLSLPSGWQSHKFKSSGAVSYGLWQT